MKDANRLSGKIFKNGMAKLEILFNRELKPEALVFYYEKVKNFNNKEFTDIVENIIDNEDFFPSIAKFLKFKSQEQPVLTSLTDEKLRELNE